METPLSGSHLGPHRKRITRSVQQGRLQRSSLFLVHSPQRRLILLQPRIRTEAFDDEYKYVLTELGSPFKGLGVNHASRSVMESSLLGSLDAEGIDNVTDQVGRVNPHPSFFTLVCGVIAITGSSPRIAHKVLAL